MTSPPQPPYAYPYRPRTSRRKTVVIVSGIALCCTLAIVLFIYAIFSALRNSDATKLAVATAEANPLVLQRAGGELRVGRFVSGSIQKTNGGGSATLEIPVSGSKGEGTLYVTETRAAGVWRIETLDFGSTGQTIQRIVPAP